LEDELIIAMADLDEEKTLKLVEERIQAGFTPVEIVECCKKGVEIVGKRYYEEIYFLSDLIMSEGIFRDVMRILEPYFPINVQEKGSKIIIETVEGDIHDLGKNIMVYLLRSSGFQVYDLGVDVPPEKFVEAVNETGAPILGISVLLSFCVGSIKKVVDLLQETGLRSKVLVVVGGYPVSDLVKEYTGVDFCFNDAGKAMKLISELRLSAPNLLLKPRR